MKKTPGFRRFLATAGGLLALAAIVVFVVAIIDGSGLLAAVSVILLGACAAFVWPWAWLQGNSEQEGGLGSNQALSSANAEPASVQGLPSGIHLVRRHLRPALAIVFFDCGRLGYFHFERETVPRVWRSGSTGSECWHVALSFRRRLVGDVQLFVLAP